MHDKHAVIEGRGSVYSGFSCFGEEKRWGRGGTLLTYLYV